MNETEAAVSLLLSWGCPASDIAEIMYLAPETVAGAIKSAMKKAGVHSKTQLIRYVWSTQF